MHIQASKQDRRPFPCLVVLEALDTKPVGMLGVPCVMDGYVWAPCAPVGER